MKSFETHWFSRGRDGLRIRACFNGGHNGHSRLASGHSQYRSCRPFILLIRFQRPESRASHHASKQESNTQSGGYSGKVCEEIVHVSCPPWHELLKKLGRHRVNRHDDRESVHRSSSSGRGIPHQDAGGSEIRHKVVDLVDDSVLQSASGFFWKRPEQPPGILRQQQVCQKGHAAHSHHEAATRGRKPAAHDKVDRAFDN